MASQPHRCAICNSTDDITVHKVRLCPEHREDLVHPQHATLALTEEQLVELANLRGSDHTIDEIAEELGVSRWTICNYLYRRRSGS